MNDEGLVGELDDIEDDMVINNQIILSGFLH